MNKSIEVIFAPARVKWAAATAPVQAEELVSFALALWAVCLYVRRGSSAERARISVDTVL